MKSDLRCALQDVARYYRGLHDRVRLRRAGAGVDYGSDAYSQQAQRTVERVHPRSMRLRVVERIEETPSTRTFRFERIDGPLPPFRAGQYVSLALSIGEVQTTRAYSVSSPPGADRLDLTVRLNPGGFASPHLFEHAVPGWQVTARGPTGSFVYEPLIDRGPLVLLAGGSGITPFMSMIRHQARVGWEHEVDLVYGSRRVDDVIFGSELAALAAEHSQLRYRLVISDPEAGHVGATGLVDAGHIRALVGDLVGRTFLVCGPAAMYEHCSGELAKLGVPRHKIRRELYGPPADVTKSAGWPEGLTAARRVRIEVVGHGSFSASVVEPLLNSLERNGLRCPSTCRSGECADCRVRVLSGRTFSACAPCVRESDRANGYVHACVSYPLEDLRLELS